MLCRYFALRKAEKEEEKRAREKIRQRLQQDKVMISCISIVTKVPFLADEEVPLLSCLSHNILLIFVEGQARLGARTIFFLNLNGEGIQ